ncbi:MAG: tyrosine-type recombinase/integrase [Methanobacteriaceae archaeon]|nr:tyrosine-type recombinase/integrase [Methanobacteriaceae archaeon]
MKFSGDDLQCIDYWVLHKDLEDSTLRTYLQCLKYYCNLINLSPDELIRQADAEEEKGIKLRDRRINFYFLKFKKQLMDDNKAESTVNLYIYAVKSFYDAMDIQLPKIKMSRGDIGLEMNYGKLISKEEISELVNVAAPREKALIYLMALSGMAQAEARNLTIRKFMDAAGEAIHKDIQNINKLFDLKDELKDAIITLHITRRKVNYRYITFIPPEATKYIIMYLKERVYGRNKKIRIRDYDSSLFVKNNGDPIDRDVIVNNFRRLGLQAGFSKRDGAYSFWRAHGMRKYFISTIMNKLGDKVLADFLAGHKISDVDRAYWYMDPEDLKKRYLKALPYLSIDKAKVIDIKSDDYKRIEELERTQELLREQLIKTEKTLNAIENNPEILELLKKKD